MKWPTTAWLYAALALAQAAGQTAAMREAMAAMQRGDFQSAERTLRGEVAAHPDDLSALSLLGAALDNEKKIPEADEVYRRAAAKAPRSIDVLNSYAAHLRMAGNEQDARKIYLQVVALDPAQYNANLQLARLALNEKNGTETLRCLDRLPANQRENPQALLFRLEALYLSGDSARGDALAARLSVAARTDLKLSFAAGTALSNARQYGKAEAFFENALKADPTNLNVLYNLGVVATYAGHYGRAREVLETVLRQQPRNVDTIYALARANEALKQWEPAVRLLAEAAKLDPQRADVQQLLALTTSELGAFDDAAAAWDRYLKLAPDDEIGRRERSYTAVQMGQLEQGIAGLERFIAWHPGDAVGQYELGRAAERSLDMTKALGYFDKALELDPNYVPARTARGSLYYQEGKPESAVKDLEIAASLRADDAATLDRLGQTYQALDRTADAVRVLRKGAELAPDNSKYLLHFARALADAGNIDESKAVMDRFRQLGPEKPVEVPAGFVEYLSLTDEQRHADYRARVEKAVRNRPEDAAARVAWLKLLLTDHKTDGDSERVTEAAHAIALLKPGATLLADAGHALLAARQYGLATELLTQASAAAPSSDLAAGIAVDLALAALGGGNPDKGLDLLDRMPEAQRNGDYYLVRAEILSVSGKSQEAMVTIDRALRAAPASPDFYRQAAAFLIENHQETEALRFLDQAVSLMPGNREILLIRAGSLELLRRTDEAERVFSDIENRWPEWYTVWLAHGIVLRTNNRKEDARRALDTAIALGAPADLVNLDLRGFLERALFMQ